MDTPTQPLIDVSDATELAHKLYGLWMDRKVKVAVDYELYRVEFEIGTSPDENHSNRVAETNNFNVIR